MAAKRRHNPKFLVRNTVAKFQDGFGQCCNKNKNIYNIRPNSAKFLSINNVISMSLCLLFFSHCCMKYIIDLIELFSKIVTSKVELVEKAKNRDEM